MPISYYIRKSPPYFVYGLVANGKIRYIGITLDIKRRLREHLKCLGNSAKDRWVKDCIKNNIPITITVIRYGLDPQNAVRIEKQIISRLRSQVFNTYISGQANNYGYGYIRRKIKAASERGRKMVKRRWELDRQRRAKLAALTAEQYPTKIVRRIIVIDDDKTVKEATFWSFESRRSWTRKERAILH